MKYRLLFPAKPEGQHGHPMIEYWREKDVATLPAKYGFYEVVYEDEYDRLSDSISGTLDKLYQRHNEGDNLDGDRPRAREIRSMCVGDIIHFVELKQAWMCDREGWSLLTNEQLPIVLDKEK